MGNWKHREVLIKFKIIIYGFNKLNKNRVFNILFFKLYIKDWEEGEKRKIFEYKRILKQKFKNYTKLFTNSPYYNIIELQINNYKQYKGK